MTLRRTGLSDDERHDTWIGVIERIYQEQVSHAWSHYLFRLLRAVFSTNERLSAEGGFLFDWMVRNYVDSTLMLLRRELDKQAGTENLRNLLFDMIEHPHVVTRARYVSRWNDGSIGQWLANKAFDRFAGGRGADTIAPELIKADLERVEKSAGQLRQYAERTRAHRTPEQRVDATGMTFQALHDAIADVRDVIGRYYSLLTQKTIAQWEPVPQYDTLEAFESPWVVNRAAVRDRQDPENRPH